MDHKLELRVNMQLLANKVFSRGQGWYGTTPLERCYLV